MLNPDWFPKMFSLKILMPSRPWVRRRFCFQPLSVRALQTQSMHLTANSNNCLMKSVPLS